MKKWQKTALISLGILILLFLIGNFGLNFWLKHNLPDYIRKNSHYRVNYKSLDVDLGTGNISATALNIASKNPNNQNVIGLEGSIDSLKISRLGLYDALVNKRISSSDLLMVRPTLKVTLAKPIDNRTGKKRNPALFENIRIKDGNILILRHTKQKFLDVSNLMLDVQNLRMTEEDVENKLPVVFDEYNIQGKHFYFRPDNVYAMKAAAITTKNGLMNIKNFRLIPLLSYAQFVRYFPKKRNLFDFQASDMAFKDIKLKNNEISLTNVAFLNPKLKMFTTQAKPQEKEKSFKYIVNLDDVSLKDAVITILKPNGSPLFSAADADVNISKILMDEKSAKGTIPFQYEKFDIRGRDINYFSDHQDIKVASLALNERSGDLRSISIRPTASPADKASIHLTGNRLRFTVDEWSLENNKLKLKGNQLIADGFNGSITAPANPVKKQNSYSGIEFPLTVKNISVKNSSITYGKAGEPMTLTNMNANISGLEMNGETVKGGVPFKTGSYSLTTSNLNYRAGRFYNLSAGLLKMNKNTLQINNLALKPLVSRSEFIRMIPTERDLYDLTAAQINVNGSWDLASANKFFNASSINISGANANIFRSKLPKDDQTVKPMYSALLRAIKFPFFADVLTLKNSVLVYEEDTKTSEGPGKLTFSNFNLTARNLNSAKMQGKPTKVPIDIHCSFMNASPMNVKWNFDTANMSDVFQISGNISDLPAARINPFIEPYLKIRATGLIQDLIFNFNGNKSVLNGKMNLKHQDLKVSVLKQDGEKNKLLSAVANMLVKTSSGSFPESVTVDHVQRDPTKSFFNFFWQGIQEGLKKTLIGKNIEQTEKTVKNTVEDAKSTVKDTKSAVADTKDKVSDTKEKVNANIDNTKDKLKQTTEKSKGFINKIFRKKEKKE